MNHQRTAVVLIGMLVSSLGLFAVDAPTIWKNWEINQFENAAPEDVASLFGSLVGEHPPAEILAIAEDKLAAHKSFREWLPMYFESTPVLWENYSERNRILYVVHHIPSEWAVRFLLQLASDERPMTSNEFSYSEVIDDLRERHAEGESINDEIGYYLLNSRDLKPAYGNDLLARSNLVDAGLWGLPSFDDRNGVPIDKWLGMPGQRDRIPEIVRETWGERAVLNVDLGLGPDNKPLSVSSGATPPERGSPTIGNDALEGMNEVGEEGKIGAPLMIALIILGISGIFALLAKRRSV